jgi:hypothetical protein
MAADSKFFRPDQRVGQIDEHHQHGAAAEQVVEHCGDPRISTSETLAKRHVGHQGTETGNSKHQQQDSDQTDSPTEVSAGAGPGAGI